MNPGGVLAFSGPPGVAYIPGTRLVFPGCPTAPVVLGHFLILSLPGQFCLVPTTSSEVVTLDCQATPQALATSWVGFSNSAGAPCMDGTPCPLSVDPTPWGSVKGLYR
ncbi:MAG: hypothetical protein ACT4PE_01750 [Candidatus Eiseniibacteriota bacterium]